MRSGLASSAVLKMAAEQNNPVVAVQPEPRRALFNPRGPLALDPRAYGADLDQYAAPTPKPNIIGNVAVIDIVGPLVHHSEKVPDGPFGSMFKCLDSYDAIKSRCRIAAESSAKCALLNIDCPGGLVAGCFDTAAEIEKIFADAGKPLYCYVDAQATSGGYALACAASRVFIPPTGIVGSIGVIDTLIDQTSIDSAMGVKFFVVTSGARKSDGNPHVPVTEDAYLAAQSMVDTLSKHFHEVVGAARGLDPAVVKGYECGLFCGKDAISAGLADEIATFDQVLAILESGPLEASAEPNPSTEPPTDSGASAMVASASSSNEAAVSGGSEGAEMSALRKMLLDEAAEDSPAGRKAKKALMAYDEPEEEKKEEPKEEAKAESEDPPPPPHKEPDGDEDDKEKEPEAAAAKSGLAMAARLQALEAAESKRAAAAERSKLMATRSDLSTEVVAWLDKQPLSVVRSAVKELPVGHGKGGQVSAARAAIDATPTLGLAASKEPTPAGLPGTPATSSLPNTSGDGDFLDDLLGIGKPKSPIVMSGTRLSLGVCTSEMAREFQKNGGAL